MTPNKTYEDKRSFEATPEPIPAVDGNVDPGTARPGPSFVIHQHHARRLHFDLRLEMMNGDIPVLVSWAVPKNLPASKGKVHLAVHVEDHPFEYGSFTGTIPAGQYGAGEVRIFDRGQYEVLEQDEGKLSIRLTGERVRGVYHLNRTRYEDGKDDWIVLLAKDERPPPDDLPPLTPMLATLETEAFDDDRWLFEPKWDGLRALAYCAHETMLVSRSGRNMTAGYPELSRLHEQLVAGDALLDGEVVAMENGRPSFERLQGRMNLQSAGDIAKAVKSIPIVYIIFDLIYLDGRSLTGMPVEERKDLLAGLVVPSSLVQVSPYVTGEGKALSEASKAQNLEGIVAKKLGSPYRPGKRTREWLKIKTVFEADVVVGGWSPGEGGRSDTFGALLVGAYADEGLRFLGAVGTGFSDSALRDLMPLLRDQGQPDSPFAGNTKQLSTGRFGKTIKNPQWIRPDLVVCVEFRELTLGDRLRAPSFKGLRDDKSSDECSYTDVADAAGRTR
ncbi:MAG: non-homologous end-joining DNA ligase [Actinomycetota bacterium]|nr:non-homologous end-joining DNA ligase [Actinomycetota bacterium]